MPLLTPLLSNKIYKAFTSMEELGDREVNLSQDLANSFSDFIKGGVVTTTDIGTGPGGTYVGAGTGQMLINTPFLFTNLFSFISDPYLNEDGLSSGIAQSFNDVVQLPFIITGNSTGTLTTSSGSSSFSGPFVGNFKSNVAQLRSDFYKAFYGMKDTEKYESQLANDLSLALFKFMKSGIITISLRPPFTGGSGVGSIS